MLIDWTLNICFSPLPWPLVPVLDDIIVEINFTPVCILFHQGGCLEYVFTVNALLVHVLYINTVTLEVAAQN